MEAIRESSPQLKARMAGVFYLLNGGTGFAFSVRSRLIVQGDAAATPANVLAHERLFRMALVADLLGVAAYVVVTTLLFQLFKPVNRSLSLVAAAFSIVGCAIQASACVFDLGALRVLEDGQALSAFIVQQSQATALMLLRLQLQGFNIAIVFFGFYCMLIGYLIYKSIFMPRVIGVAIALGGLAYVVNNVAMFLATPLPMVFSHLVPILGGLGELSLMLWLLAMGVNAQQWKEQAAGED
jgi:hypothetical protein